MQIEELVQVRIQEAEARVAVLSWQQDLSKKTEAQQAQLLRSLEIQKIPQVTIEHDIEAYLEAFERAVLAADWDPSGWAYQLGPLLIGQAQAAYMALSQEEASDYQAVKKAILLARIEIAQNTIASSSGQGRKPRSAGLDC